MQYDFTGEQRAWRDEIRAFIKQYLTAELLAELREAGNEGKGPMADRFILALRDRGYWGLAWPAEYGGLGRSAIDQWIFVDELESAGAPMLPLTVTSVAPTIMRIGTEAQKKHWSTSPSPTRSQTPAPTWRRCARAPCSTATSG